MTVSSALLQPDRVNSVLTPTPHSHPCQMHGSSYQRIHLSFHPITAHLFLVSCWHLTQCRNMRGSLSCWNHGGRERHKLHRYVFLASQIGCMQADTFYFFWVACDSSCSSCSGTSTYCTACANLDQFSLNGTCVASCPMGFFSSTNATCLACHPDCATCGPTFDTCLTCPSTRPVLSSSGTCLQTCSSNQYFDHPTGSCVACSSSCETCSGNGSGDCLSCGSTATLSSGNCVDAGCTVVDGFGVCLSQLVTISAPSVSDGIKIKIILPWWTILLIVLCVVGFIGVVAWFWRRRERKRREFLHIDFSVCAL